MSMILALFSEKLASCKTLSIFLLMLKSAGTSCWDERHDFKIQTGWCVILKERRRKKKETCSFKRGGKKEKEKLWLRGTHDCTQRHTMTHHVVYRAVDSVVLFQQLFYCSGPGNYKPAASSSSSSLLVCFSFWQKRFLWGWQRLKQAGTHLKAAPRVLFFLTKAILTRPSHSLKEKTTQQYI